MLEWKCEWKKSVTFRDVVGGLVRQMGSLKFFLRQNFFVKLFMSGFELKVNFAISLKHYSQPTTTHSHRIRVTLIFLFQTKNFAAARCLNNCWRTINLKTDKFVVVILESSQVKQAREMLSELQLETE